MRIEIEMAVDAATRANTVAGTADSLESLYDTIYRCEKRYGPVERMAWFSDEWWTLLLRVTK